ncbi:hypothetical protein V6N13_111539 [Hibiscus sabdariffa]
MSTINPGDPRLPKKQRRRDEAPPDSVLPHTGVLPDDKLPPPELAASVMECDNNQLSSDRVYAANQSISYKEAVTGVNSSIDEDLIPLDDDDIELFEDDFRLDNGRRGRFARMAVKINLRQPLVSKIIVNGRTQIVEYESLPIVCFSCGTYGHANHNCPRDKLVESAMDSDLPQLINPPNQQPVESYGPWMLVERRRRRPALSRLPPNPVVENPRYNPIFLETDNDNLPPTADNTPSAPSSPHRSNSTPRQVPIVQDQVVLPASPPVIPGSVPTERVQDSDTRSHSSNARTKGKSPISLRKSALVVLGSRDMNIMIRKPTPGASSSRRSSKARSQPSNLNPTKHSAVVLSESAPPVTMLQLQQKQTDHSASPIDNSKSLTRTNSAPPLNNSVSVSQEPLGHLAMADC